MPRVVPGRRSITSIFTEAEYEQIKVLASRKNTSMNEVVRGYTIEGLSGTLTQQNMEFLIPILREQLDSIIDPAVHRLASLSAKTCVQAGAAAYLSAEALMSFVPEHLQKDFQEAYEQARKKAVAYTKSRADLD